jgi:hypothetical protein
VLGVVLFELTGHRVMLFIFPNLFENWWVWCALTKDYLTRLEDLVALEHDRADATANSEDGTGVHAALR